jgi:GNAT superfamily N-acetyltransferase
MKDYSARHEPTVRPFTAPDMPHLMRLSREAGWNQTEDDWLRIIQLEPEGCFAIECAGELVATATAYCYGEELAWIGMVLTAVEYRRRGFGRRLMEESLAFTRRRGVRWIKLDSTDMGKPLYSDLGFQDEYAVERWKRAAGSASAATADPFALPALVDREAFGADRSRLLETLAPIESASVGDAGYAMGRPGSRATYFGPCVARDPVIAGRLLRWFLWRHQNEDIFWDLIPDNPAAVALAREWGFLPARRLTRMRMPGRRATTFHERPGLIYALAGFEYG